MRRQREGLFQMPRLSITFLVLSAVVSGILLAGCPPGTEGAPQAAFTAIPKQGQSPLTVQFKDASIAGDSPVQAWIWDFGNGTTSTRPNPTVTYYEPGDYTVRLTVASARGQSTATIPNYITVTPGSEFGAIGPQGGAHSAKGVTLTVPAGALTRNVVFGITQQPGNLPVSVPEPITQASPTFLIRHNNTTDRVYASILDDAIQPATLEIPFQPEVAPPADCVGDHFQILAQLDDGTTLPILGRVNCDAQTVEVDIMRLPARARYAVVYRPASDSFVVDVNNGKAPTAYAWQHQWRINLSGELLQQLTALRFGALNNTAPFYRRNFTSAQLDDTKAQIGAAIDRLQAKFSDPGLRSPALVNHDGAYSLVFFNMQAAYSSAYEAFREVHYRDRRFGSIIIDPRQLIAIAVHNANTLAADPENVDPAQVLTFANAFAQELFQAAFEGYEYPAITAPAPADLDPQGQPRPISFLAGLDEGLTAFLGQSADNLLTARGFGANEYALLSQPLLYPFDENIPGYAVANQEFFFYLQNTAALEDEALAYLFSHLPLAGGILEQIRAQLAVATTPGSPPLSFLQASGIAAVAMDSALKANLGVSLAQVYRNFVRARAIENPDNARLRPSDADRTPFFLNEDRFAADAVITEELQAPTDGVELSANDLPALRDIPPLSSRVIVLQVNPLATELALTFNADEWESDPQGNTLAISVYKAGQPGLDLALDGTDDPEDEDTLNDMLLLTGFTEDPQECYASVYILVSNLSLSTVSSLALTAETFAELTIAESGVLRKYVQACDPHYSYELVGSSTIAGSGGATAYILHMTSGAWRGPQDVNQTLWSHYLTIVEPPVVRSDTALLVISGGSTNSMPSASTAQLLLPFCLATGSVGVLVRAVPNQPLIFTGETSTRTEDAILAYSYDKYMNGYVEGHPDMTWPALLPMARAAVRTMDTVQDFMATGSLGLPATIRKFVVTGASKRGWTTWLTAAADTRVSAIMPVVIDVLNIAVQMQHHYNAYGFYSDAIQDYVDANVFDRLGTLEGDSLLKIIDPYRYRQRLTIPKMIVNSTGDQFFLPDSSQFYFGQLLGSNWLSYVPNTDHSIASSAGLDVDDATSKSMLAFYIAHLRNTNDTPADDVQIPTFTWTVEAPNRIVVNTPTAPESVMLWQATNTATRDFRIETIGQVWTATDLCAVPGQEGESTCTGGQYVGEVEAPATGWTAFMIQLTYPGPDPELDAVKFIFSTQVVVFPDVYPEFD